MYSTQDIQAIASTELNSYLEAQANEIAPEPIRVRTPQRKANYRDKERIRRKRLREIALEEYRCYTTADVKRLLRILGVNLDLRLSSAWDAVVFELRPWLLAIRQTIEIDPPPPRIKVGDYVIWENAPTYLHACWNSLQVLDLIGDRAVLEMWSGDPVAIDELAIA